MTKDSKKPRQNPSNGSTDPSRRKMPASPKSNTKEIDPGDEVLLELGRRFDGGTLTLGTIMACLNELSQIPRYQRASDKRRLLSLFSWAARLCGIPNLETGLSGNLTAKCALVSNATYGVGPAICLGLVEAGVEVIANYDTDEEGAHELQIKLKSLNPRCLAVRADVSDPDAVREMIRMIEQKSHLVHILVNNPFNHAPVFSEAMDEASWEAILNNSLRPTFLPTEAVMPGMLNYGWGRIINISDIAWYIAGSDPARDASMAGIIGLTRSYAQLLAKKEITVNAITPGFIASEDGTAIAEISPDSIPVGRYGKPEEIATVVIMLARVGFITGQNIHMNGGVFMG